MFCCYNSTDLSISPWFKTNFLNNNQPHNITAEFPVFCIWLPWILLTSPPLLTLCQPAHCWPGRSSPWLEVLVCTFVEHTAATWILLLNTEISKFKYYILHYTLPSVHEKVTTILSLELPLYSNIFMVLHFSYNALIAHINVIKTTQFHCWLQSQQILNGDTIWESEPVLFYSETDPMPTLRFSIWCALCPSI